MKKLLALLLFLPSFGFCDSKISAMASTTNLNTTDIIPVVINPGTTPANRIITFQNLYNSIPSTVTAASIGALTTSSATATYLQLSSASATYLQQSSATATYLQISSATANYPKLAVGNLFTQSNTYASSSTFNGAVIVSTSINAGGQGTSGQFLTSGGPNAVVSWTTGGSGNVVLASTQVFTGGNTFISSTTFSGTLFATSSTTIKGTTTNDNAALGNIGEVISSSTLQSVGISMTTGNTFNIASVSLTAGQWSVSSSAGVKGAAGTTLSELQSATTLTSATLPGSDNIAVPDSSGQIQFDDVFSPVDTIGGNRYVAGQLISVVKLATTTTVYLVVNAAFGVNTLTAYGNITATRIR